jgi:hypothetical protein
MQMKTNSPPDLQELVVAVGGYDKITPEMWAAFDRAMDAYQQMRRNELANDKADPARDIFAAVGVLEQTWPYACCVDCGAEAHFGYRNAAGELEWFCVAHRLACWWADARRGGRP